MVFLTSDWKNCKGYFENCRVGTFQLRETVDGHELRIRAGRLGFIREFKLESEGKHEKEEFLQEIMTFCGIQGFVEVTGSMSDELFHL